MPRSRIGPLPPGTPYRLVRYLRTQVEPAAKKRVEVVHTFGGTPDAVERVRHKLGKLPSGFTVTTQDGAGTVYRTDAMPRHDRFFLYLKCSAASRTVRLDVF